MFLTEARRPRDPKGGINHENTKIDLILFAKFARFVVQIPITVRHSHSYRQTQEKLWLQAWIVRDQFNFEDGEVAVRRSIVIGYK